MSYEYVYPDAVAQQLADKMNLPVARAREHVEKRGGSASGATPHPRTHYEKADPVIAELGEIDALEDAVFCGGCHGRKGWYRTRDTGDNEGIARLWKPGDEFPKLRRRADREIFGTITYAAESWFSDAWTRYTYPPDTTGREWDGDKPVPDYGDVRAFAPFADIDLPSEIKRKRPTGDAPRETVERALSEYIAAFAELAGDRKHVFVLDSVGGAYCFVAPTATAPIAAAFSGEDKALLIEDMSERLNEWLDQTAEEVINTVPESEGVFEPDLLNNKNRLFKLPLSVHGSLDGAVTPLDPAAPSYEFTPLEAVDGTVVADAQEWAREFTADHTAAVSSVVSTLWPELAAAADNWTAALRRRVEKLKDQQRGLDQTEISTTHPLERDRDPPDRDISDVERTDDIDDVTAAIEQIDAEKLAREVADEWDTAPNRNDETRLKPDYRHSGSGTSVFVDKDKLVDLDTNSNSGGGPITIVALAERIITSPDQSVSGDDYWRAVQALRDRGHHIPYYVGKSGTHPDVLRLYDDSDSDHEKRVKALRAARASDRSSN